MDFRKNLKENRKKARLSQEDLADRLSVSRQTISKWESGDAYPSMKHILELADLFGCGLNELVDSENVSDFPLMAAQEKRHWFNSSRFYRFAAITVIMAISVLFGFCISSVNQTKETISPKTAVQMNMIDSDLFTTIASGFLDDVFTDEGYNYRLILGYGFAETNNAFYIKCKLCKDGIPTAAIIYFHKSGDSYSYECEYPDDFNYCPTGEYHMII